MAWALAFEGHRLHAIAASFGVRLRSISGSVHREEEGDEAPYEKGGKGRPVLIFFRSMA